MKDLLIAGRGLLADIASTLLFAALYAVSGSVLVSVGAGMALALGQIGWRLAHRQKVDALQWVSLVLVLSAGGASLWTHDPRFVMAKPSLIYVLVGSAMLQRNWMARYMPADAMALLPDLVVLFGYVWAGLMFVSAVVNLVLAAWLDVVAWAAAMSVYGIASKVALFFIQYGTMKFIGRRRYRAARPDGAAHLQRA
jgi:intracellular septation protein A